MPLLYGDKSSLLYMLANLVLSLGKYHKKEEIVMNIGLNALDSFCLIRVSSEAYDFFDVFYSIFRSPLSELYDSFNKTMETDQHLLTALSIIKNLKGEMKVVQKIGQCFLLITFPFKVF